MIHLALAAALALAPIVPVQATTTPPAPAAPAPAAPTAGAHPRWQSGHPTFNAFTAGRSLPPFNREIHIQMEPCNHPGPVSPSEPACRTMAKPAEVKP